MANQALNYDRRVLHGNEQFEVVSCHWTDASQTVQHDHGWSECFVLIEEGCFENRVDLGLRSEVTVHNVGDAVITPKAAEHQLRCLSKTGKTLHFYTPKIKSRAESKRFSHNSRQQIRETLDLGLGADSISWLQLKAALDSIVSQSISTHSPFFMNQLFSGIFPETILANAVAAQTKTTLATFEASPVFSSIELEVVEQLGALVGWPSGKRDGVCVPGGSAGNFMAIQCARQQKIPTYKTEGSRGEKLRVFVSEEAHYSFKKACIAMGLGSDAIVLIACDQFGKMNPKDLSEKLDSSIKRSEIPLLVCATAGTTVLGAFDPITEISATCQKYNVWLHVDAAWGGPALFSKRARALVDGIEQADSVTFDAHKLFGAELTSSFFINRHPGLLLAANDVSGAEYLFHNKEEATDRGRLSWQCGRGADALSFWTLWKSNGINGLGSFVDRLFRVRDESIEWIKSQPRLQLLHEPSFLNICVRIKAPDGHPEDQDWSKKVREQLRDKDLAFINFAKDKQGSFLRLILANPKINREHIKTMLGDALLCR